MARMDLSGLYEANVDGNVYNVILPGTLDENKIGEKEQGAEAWHPDAKIDESAKCGVITTRFTRKHAWEGTALFTKSFTYEKNEGKRVFLEVERARDLKAELNGISVPEYKKGTLSTPYVFEVTDYIGKENRLTFISSNLYESLPKDAIKFSSAATNETQTNWNGLLGKIELREENNTFIKSVRVLPKSTTIDVFLEIDSLQERSCNIEVKSSVIEGSYEKACSLSKGINEIVFCDIALKPDAAKWDEYEGNLQTLTVLCDEAETKSVNFGIRVFGDDSEGHLSLNGHRIFLRGEANCCVFANSGHMPMTVNEWEKCLKLYKDYGVNCVRFHSHCPPDAAFEAADKLGVIVQPELSNWDPKHAFESDESFSYYKKELNEILETYANHPSFCMMTFGNELQCNQTGVDRLRFLAETARKKDPTRMYAIASNEFYGWHGTDDYSDFYTSSNYYNDMIRGTNAGMYGHINNSYPGTKTDYSMPMAKIRGKYKKPVFSFEVGQYEVLPDFTEIEKFEGVLSPDNLEYVKANVEKAGFAHKWEKWVQATGELSRIAYREEVEACLRTEDMSGISLLGLQDFPGQGTALVGMINSHFETKPYEFAKSEKFRQFFASRVPLVKMDKYTYTTDEVFEFELLFANYGKEDIGGIWRCELEGVGLSEGSVEVCPRSKLTKITVCRFALDKIEESKKCTLKVWVGDYVNEYYIWVYKDAQPQAGDVIVSKSISEAMTHLKCGKKVFLAPKAEEACFVNSVKTQFTTDFWSVGTFPQQSGYMGIFPDPKHPLFNCFPTDEHSDWQWWSLTNSRAMVLDEKTEPLFDVLDSYARLRKLAFMVEAKVGEGKLLLCSMGLEEKCEYPEVRAMLKSIYSYMNSDDFNPRQELTEEALKRLLNV